MIELKDKLDIPDGYYIWVGPVYRGGFDKDLIIQDLKLKKANKWWFDRTIFKEMIFLTESGRLKFPEGITFKDLKKAIHEIHHPPAPPQPPKDVSVIRPGRHP